MKREHWGKEFPQVTEEAIREFAQCIGDFNPIHHQVESAKDAGLHGIIAPGVMMIGFASAAIAEEIPGVIIRKLELKFKQPMYAGSLPIVLCSTSHARGPVLEIGVSIRNGGMVLAEGNCTLLCPK